MRTCTQIGTIQRLPYDLWHQQRGHLGLLLLVAIPKAPTSPTKKQVLSHPKLKKHGCVKGQRVLVHDSPLSEQKKYGIYGIGIQQKFMAWAQKP